MANRKRKYFPYYFCVRNQLFRLISVKRIENTEAVIVRGENTSPIRDVFSVTFAQVPILPNQIIEKSKEPLIQNYIDACYTKDKALYEEILKELIIKYQKHE